MVDYFPLQYCLQCGSACVKLTLEYSMQRQARDAAGFPHLSLQEASSPFL